MGPEYSCLCGLSMQECLTFFSNGFFGTICNLRLLYLVLYDQTITFINSIKPYQGQRFRTKTI